MLGISGEGGSAAKLWTTQGEDRPLAWCSWRHRGHALCVCSVCRTCHLTSGPRGQTSTFSLSMFAAAGSCVFASTLIGGADVPLSMREEGVRVDRCRFRVVMKAMSPSTCDGKAGGVCCLRCWVDSGFDIADAVFRECGENRNSQARSHGGSSSGAEEYGPPSSVVSPSALGA